MTNPTLINEGPLITALCQRFSEALRASADRVIEAHPERADECEAWIDEADMTLAAVIKTTDDGNPDPASLTFHVGVVTSLGPAPLFEVLASDLVTWDGEQVDALAEAETLLMQHGVGIPDDVSSLDS